MRNWIKRTLAAALALSAGVSLLQPAAAALTPYREPSAEYAESVYYERLCAVELSGDYRTDLVNVALSQIGYHEGDERADYGGGNTGGWHNYIEYGSIYGGLNAQWCAMFVSWCARQAGIPSYIISNAARASVDGTSGSNRFWFHMNYHKKANWQPAVGDLVFFAGDGRYTSHVGIVAEVTESGLYSVEGNSMDAVRMRYYDYDDEYIHGYAVYAEKPESLELPVPTRYEIVFECGGGDSGTMPDGDSYAFSELLAVQGREFTLPAGAFAREGCELLGYYASRPGDSDDGLWYCGGDEWLSPDEMERKGLKPALIADGQSWCYEGSWTDSESMSMHCIWQSIYGPTIYSTGIPDSFKRDENGWINPFIDVGADCWYYDSARKGLEDGIISAEYGSWFDGNSDATRAQFISMLYRAAGSPQNGAAGAFDDVPEEHWAYAASVWAREAGVTEGIGDNLFAPDDVMSREQMVTLLYRWLGKGDGCALDFPDAGEVSEWAVDAMMWAVGSGLINGMADGDGNTLLSPKSSASRAQALTLTLRLMDENGI